MVNKHLLEMNSNVKLKQVTKNDMLFLYEHLKKKDPSTNISHKKMPSYDEHVEFVMSKPYTNWYIIECDKKNVGSIYLSKQDEIGIHFKESLKANLQPKSMLVLTIALQLTVEHLR